MKLFATILVLVMCMLVAGCFHATIETGLQPDGQRITQKWASGWIYGLVPPKTVETAAKCPNGVSKVQTQRSFLTGLVGALTLGIYTPMEIVVDCASGTSSGELPNESQEIIVSESASPEEIQKAFSDAATLSYKTEKPVYVRFAEVEVTSVGM